MNQVLINQRVFKVVVPTFEDWIATLNAETTLDTPNNLSLHKYFYDKLMRRFANQEIAFDNDYDFIAELLNTYEDTFMEFTKRKEWVDAMHTATEKDILTSQSISSNANNPNTENVLPTQILNYINTQNYSQDVMKRNEGLYRALLIIPTGIINEYLLRFRRLFTIVYNKKDYMW